MIFSIRALIYCKYKDYNTAENYLKQIISEKLTHEEYFCVTISWLYIGNRTLFNKYFKQNRELPQWMKEWIDLEYLAKDKQYKKVIKYLSKINSNNRSYLYYAFFRGIDLNVIPNKYRNKILSTIDKESYPEYYNIINMDTINSINYYQPSLLTVQYKDLFFKYINIDEYYNSEEECFGIKFSDIKSISYDLSTLLASNKFFQKFELYIVYLIKTIPKSIVLHGTILSFYLIYLWLNRKFDLFANSLKNLESYSTIESIEPIKNIKVFYRYLLSLGRFQLKHSFLYETSDNVSKTIFVIGESHSLTLTGLNVSLDNNLYKIQNYFLMGVKMFHMSQTSARYRILLNKFLDTISKDTNLLFTIGEIDTRPTEGIWKVHRERDKDINELINYTVTEYIDFLSYSLMDKLPSLITIQGIPAPNYELIDKFYPGEDKIGFLDMFDKVNTKLKELTLAKGWYFLDVYSATVNKDRRSNNEWHIDTIHYTFKTIFLHSSR